jgi:16S rRNA (adenine1518-N6/adenine1519-N6)-dimethyltransferase
LSHTFRKRWGQNFLQDPNIISKILESSGARPNDVFIEVGAGSGALTFPLAEMAKKVYAIEIDPHLIPGLRSEAAANIEILHEDFLKMDLTVFGDGIKFIGNLPYYITTPIIFKVLSVKNWLSALFMVQKEVAERICSKPGNKIYGRLSVMLQALADVEKLFDIPPTVFYPKPDVHSTVIKLTPVNRSIKDWDLFSQMVKQAFGQRRKKLRNTISEYLLGESKMMFEEKRPEVLSVEEFILISNSCAEV